MGHVVVSSWLPWSSVDLCREPDVVPKFLRPLLQYDSEGDRDLWQGGENIVKGMNSEKQCVHVCTPLGGEWAEVGGVGGGR